MFPNRFPFRAFANLAAFLAVASALPWALAGCSSLPPRKLQLSIRTRACEVDVQAKAEDKSVGDRKNDPRSVQACVTRCLGELERLGFGAYLEALRERPTLVSVFPRLSGCAFDGFDDDDDHDRFLLPFALHETTHLLGSILDGVCPGRRPTCADHETRYTVFTGQERERRLDIPLVPKTPSVGALARELWAETMLDTMRTYLGLPPRDAPGASVDPVSAALGQSDSYLLWDEWNAYLMSLEITMAQAAEADCWVYLTVDTYEIALSWPDILERYLAVVQAQQPARYRALTRDGRFRRALALQLDRSERGIAQAAKHDCVRRPRRDVADAEARYAAAYVALRCRARLP